jgi:hypothetical protein
MSDHPVFGAYEERNRWYHKVLRETWNQFYDSRPADIQAVVWYLIETKENRAMSDDNFQRLVDSPTYSSELAEAQMIKSVRGRYRLSALLDLLDYISFNGPKGVPRYEDLQPEEREKMKSWNDVPAPEAAEYAETAEVQKRRIALERLLDEQHPGWIENDLSKQEKKDAAARLSGDGRVVTLATIRKDIAHLRKMRR